MLGSDSFRALASPAPITRSLFPFASGYGPENYDYKSRGEGDDRGEELATAVLLAMVAGRVANVSCF